VLVFILLLESAFAVHSSEVASSAEVIASTQIKDMELISYNVMLDFCLQFKGWSAAFQNSTDPNTLQNLDPNIASWSSKIVNFVENSSEPIHLSLEISALDVVPYDGQPYDKYQMCYIGVSGSEKWFVTGVLIVTVTCPWLTRVSTYNISIIC
jgi:hypothetical protein